MCRISLFLVGILFFVESLAGSEQGVGFIENKGQWPVSADYIAYVPGGKMTLQPEGFGYYFLDYDKLNALHNAHDRPTFRENSKSIDRFQIEGRHVRVNFLGHNPHAVPVATQRSDTYFNYFLGNDPQQWFSGVYAYAQVSYRDLYPGVDVVLHALGDQVKYDLVIAPGADPKHIQLLYEGAQSLSLFKENLLVDAGLVRITEKRPVSYQIINGTKKYISTRYVLVGNTLSFSFPDGYDPGYELVIDPLLIFSTYSGFTADNWGSSATPGERGALYSTGMAFTYLEGTFDATPGAFQTNYGGGISDVGIFKYDSLGSRLLYASYLGGQQEEAPHSLLVNHRNELLVLGVTSSSDFPVTDGAYDTLFRGGPKLLVIDSIISYEKGSDIFVARISSDGRRVLSATYLGGSDTDGVNFALTANYGDDFRSDIIVDQHDDVFIASTTSSSDFPSGITPSFDALYNGGSTDALVVRLSPDLDTLRWMAFLGGDAADVACSIKLDTTLDTLFVAGATASRNFLTTLGTYSTAYAGNSDAGGWIAKLPADGTSVKAATFVGANDYNQVYFIDLNKEGEVYVYGQKEGKFPITEGTYSNPNSGQFLQKYSNDLSRLIYSTTFGSGRDAIDISPTAFLVNSQCNRIYVAGWGGVINQLGTPITHRALWPYTSLSSTKKMPVTEDAFQSRTAGSDFYLAVFSEDASRLLYATFMGGIYSPIHVDGGTSRFDKKGVVYHAVCAGCGGVRSDFPTTEGSWSRTNNSKGCNNAAFKFDLSTLIADVVTNSKALNNPGIQSICLPASIVFQNHSTGGEFYEWDFGDGNTLSVQSTEDIEYMYSKPGTYKVVLKAIDRQTCSGEDIDAVTLDVNTPTGKAGSDLTLCRNRQRVTLRATGGVSYLWRIAGGEPFSTSATPAVSPRDTISYVVDILDNKGCSISDTIKVNVVPSADFRFTLTPKIGCNSRTALHLRNDSPAHYENMSFDLGDGTTSTLNELVHRYDRDSTYRLRLMWEKSDCFYEKTANFPAFTTKIPNVITSGGDRDGKNDTFKIGYGKGRLASENGLNIALSIYNRWGNMVFSDAHYQNNWSASGLSAGIYYYAIKINDKTSCKGWVEVIK